MAIDIDPWFKEWFASEYYLELYMHRNMAEAGACIDLIVETIELPPGAGVIHPPRALDLASGPGRHAVALALKGFEVTAVDLSETLLDHARSEAARENVAVTFIQSDMRDIVFRDEFDLVVQLFTSFGYFDSPADDALVLRNVRDALRDGGYYALDLINERRLHETLVPQSVRQIQDVEVIEERRIEGDRVIKEITIRRNGEERRFHESVRLFHPETIDRMLRDAALIPEEWFGDYHGAPYDAETSDRMLIICRAASLDRGERLVE